MMLNITGKKIAIVEDDAASLKYYETLLRETGAEVSVFRNGKEFVEAIGSGFAQFDLVFMDFLVPLVNGIECTRAVITSYSIHYTKLYEYSVPTL